jgi:hypothetical protein
VTSRGRPRGDQHRSPPAPFLETTEIRWFTPEPLPSEVRRWFTVSTGAAEERTDTYLLEDRTDVGVKCRGGSVLELKIRQGRSNRTLLGGRPEMWRKWSPATGLVEIQARGAWLAVDKFILKRRFSRDGVEEPWTAGQQGGTFCVAEVVDIRVGTVAAWSLALAAYGPLSTRRAALVACAEAILANAPDPHRLELEARCAMSYPEWLVGTFEGRSQVASTCGAVGKSSV